MVTSTGKGLNVLIRSEYSFSSNWMSFGSWYSVQKNLPDANVAIVCERVLGYDDHRLWPAEVEYNPENSGYFMWPDRVGVSVFKCGVFDDFFIKLFDRKNCNLFDLPLLILDKGVVVVDELSSSVLDCFNEENILSDDFVMFLKDKSLKKDFLNRKFKDFSFSVDVESDADSCFVSFGENFVPHEWIHSNKVGFYEDICPSNFNETKVWDIWSQARGAFSVI